MVEHSLHLETLDDRTLPEPNLLEQHHFVVVEGVISEHSVDTLQMLLAIVLACDPFGFFVVRFIRLFMESVHFDLLVVFRQLLLFKLFKGDVSWLGSLVVRGLLSKDDLVEYLAQPLSPNQLEPEFVVAVATPQYQTFVGFLEEGAHLSFAKHRQGNFRLLGRHFDEILVFVPTPTVALLHYFVQVRHWRVPEVRAAVLYHFGVEVLVLS